MNNQFLLIVFWIFLKNYKSRLINISSISTISVIYLAFNWLENAFLVLCILLVLACLLVFLDLYISFKLLPPLILLLLMVSVAKV